MMKWMVAGAALVVLGNAPATPAVQQANTQALAQALGQCIVMKTTGEDRVTTASWFAAVIASAPQLDGIVTLAPGKKDALDKAMAALFTRLMVKDCAPQARAMFEAKDNTGFQVAGESLGRVAMQELLSNPKANASLSAYTHYLNEADFKSVTGK